MCLLTLAPSLTTNLLPPFALEPWRELGINTERERTFCSNYSRSSQNNEKKEKHTPIPAGLKESAQWSWLYSGGIKPERRGDDEDSGNEDKDEKRRTKKRRRSKKTMQTFHIAGAGISKQILERDIKVYLGPEAEFCSEMKMDCDSVDLGKRDDEREEQWFALRAYQRLTKVCCSLLLMDSANVGT